MMYCTGGIRCDIYSALLRQKGFKNLYSLEGGVARYLREKGSKLWHGSLFTFDDRIAVAPGQALNEPLNTSSNRDRNDDFIEFYMSKAADLICKRSSRIMAGCLSSHKKSEPKI